MNYIFTSSFFLQALPCLFAFLLIYILWKRRHVNGVIFLILLEFVASIWALTDAFEHAAATLPLKIFWSQVGNFGSTTTAVFFLLFTLSFTQNNKFINWKSYLFLFAIPLITLIFAFTNSRHHLIWESVDFFPETNESIYHYGRWFWIFIAYEFSIAAIAIVVLLFSILRFYKIYKNQVVYLIIGALLPLASSFVYVFKLSSLRADLTPISLIFSGICIGISIYWQGMIDIIPIARKKIFDTLSDGVLVIDMADRIIDANPAIITIAGKKDLIGTQFQILRDKLFANSFDCKHTEGNETEVEILVDNQIRFFEVQCNPVTLINEKLIGKIFIFHDITKRKKALNSYVESNKLLRKEILEKEKLIIDLDAYARSVAHDLKNPISGLLGLKDIIKEDLLNNKTEEAFDLLDLAHDQGMKMYKIVDELLLLSRIRREELQQVPLDMATIFNDALNRFNGEIETSNLSIEKPDAWPVVMGHPQWIEEVWFNFISNAIKYGGNPPQIRIGCERFSDYDWRFWIQDNGDGLHPSLFPKLFNDFERLGRHNIEGHGLGLSIVKRIIEKLGGKVLVSSNNIPGEGCIFSFTLKDYSKV